MIAVVSPSSTSTSGRARLGMKPCRKALYVSLISRCDSAAIVSNTSELLPDPETPVNTVSLRFGISTLTSLRLFTRAPCTRIRSWRSATCSAGDVVPARVAVVIGSPCGGRGGWSARGSGASPGDVRQGEHVQAGEHLQEQRQQRQVEHPEGQDPGQGDEADDHRHREDDG